MLTPARDVLRFNKGSDSPAKGVTCYFNFAAFVAFCGRSCGRSETQRVPGIKNGVSQHSYHECDLPPMVQL